MKNIALNRLQAAVRLAVLEALKFGADSSEILDRVGRGIDEAAQEKQKRDAA